MNSLYHKLDEYGQEEYYPMHMPGHKRNTKLLSMGNPYGLDVTEIEGFDNLHDAKDILKNAMERAAKIYHSKHTEYLVNGSTVGILAGIAACTKKGDKIIVARNCHKSVYNGIFLGELNPIYVYPQIVEDYGVNGGILPENIESLLINHPDIKMVIITSPTYEGIVSDIKRIVQISHSYGVPCMVDEAHGAHFGFDKNFPISSVECGADIVIHSLHKTLPSFTQTALIHINSSIIEYKKVKEYLKIYQSSSPSYLLMAGIDQCIDLLKNQGDKLFQDLNKRLIQFYENMKNLRCLKVYKINSEMNENRLGIYNFDYSKIIICVKDCNISGINLYHLLIDKYKIQVEMASKYYILAMTSICDTEEGFVRLSRALLQIDNELSFNDNGKTHHRLLNNTLVLTSYETFYKESEEILLGESAGRLSKDYIYLYPPGIPLIVPGEMISKEFVKDMIEYKRLGLLLKGFADEDLEYISVVKVE